MKTTIVDVVTRPREVELPDTCPQCKADFHGPNALTVWEYQDQKQAAEYAESIGQCAGGETATCLDGARPVSPDRITQVQS